MRQLFVFTTLIQVVCLVVLALKVNSLEEQEPRWVDKAVAEYVDSFVDVVNDLNHESKQLREDVAEYQRSTDACHRKAELLRWALKTVVRTLPNRQHLPSPPHPWPGEERQQ